MAVYGVDCCPYLGARGGLSSYCPYPVEEAICLAPLRPKGISLERQQEFCLTAGYPLCPRLARTSHSVRPRSVVGPRVPMWVSVGVIFITVGIAWGVLTLIDRNGQGIPGRTVEVSETEWKQASSGAQQPSQVGGLVNDGVIGSVGPTAAARVPTPESVPAAVSTPPGPAPTPVASPATTYHDVQPGETLTGIARLYGVTLDSLRSANGLREGDVLRAGARLSIPISGNVHVVQAGDTLTAIAQKNGISLDELAAANGIPKTANILVGQRLIIPSR